MSLFANVAWMWFRRGTGFYPSSITAYLVNWYKPHYEEEYLQGAAPAYGLFRQKRGTILLITALFCKRNATVHAHQEQAPLAVNYRGRTLTWREPGGIH